MIGAKLVPFSRLAMMVVTEAPSFQPIVVDSDKRVL